MLIIQNHTTTLILLINELNSKDQSAFLFYFDVNYIISASDKKIYV